MNKIIITFLLIFNYSFLNASGHFNFCDNHKVAIESLMLSIEDSRWRINNSSRYSTLWDPNKEDRAYKNEQDFKNFYRELILKTEDRLYIKSEIYKNLCN